MNQSFQNALGVVFALCAVGMTGAVAHREFADPAPRKTNPVRRVSNTQSLTKDGRIIGADTAKIQLVEFSDFQCPFCKAVQPDLDQLRRDYAGRVSIVYRHLPITAAHANAFTAALAAECAASQGKFAEYHDALFQNPDSVGRSRWNSLAKMAAVADLKQFDSCVQSERFKTRVENDMRLAKDAGVSGTPTFILGDRMVEGIPGLALVKVWLDSTLTR